LIYGCAVPPSTVVKLKFWTTTLAEIALQRGTSVTIVTKVPLPGLGLDGGVLEQLAKIPAKSSIPRIFASLHGGVRLKFLLRFTSGSGTLLLQRGGSRLMPRWLPIQPSASSSDDISQPWVFRMLGPQSQDFDKYSELTAEGKRYSTGKEPHAPVAGGSMPPLARQKRYKIAAAKSVQPSSTQYHPPADRTQRSRRV
jgi:hypothetical protein